MTEALDYISLERSEQHSLIAGTRKYLEFPQSEQVNELSHFDIEIYNEIIKLLKKGDEKKAVLMVTKIKNKIYEDNFLIGNIYFYGVKNDKKAEEYYKKAIEKGNSGAMNNLAMLLFERKLRKEEALELARKSTIAKKYLANLHTLLMVLLWNDEIEESIKIWKSELFKEEYINRWIKGISEIFNFFIAKKQYNFVYKVFTENKFEIKERYKPIYFALLHFMGGKYETERKKMGPELKETVDEIITAIKQMGKDYS
ncbi:MAG TPA: sel1 repeat family protein [Ignavibacteria bacterium]|nr:sel1 repeat family protein [Ignavibacteria bacterium]